MIGLNKHDLGQKSIKAGTEPVKPGLKATKRTVMQPILTPQFFSTHQKTVHSSAKEDSINGEKSHKLFKNQF